MNAAADVYWESYRALRTSLLFSSPEKRPHSILVTSAMPGEGKSTTAVNLAIALAQTGARTLILELDMRRPKLADMFQVTRRPRHEPLPLGPERVEHRNSADRHSQPVRRAGRADAAEPAGVDWLAAHERGARVAAVATSSTSSSTVRRSCR